MLIMTTATHSSAFYGKSPMRMLDKVENFRRGTPLRLSKNSKRQTAAERLEADKFKYVKSDEARQRRFTLELRTSSPPNNNDSTGSHSMGTESTGSPSNMEEDDDDDGVDIYTEEDIIATMAGVVTYKDPKSSNQNVPKTHKAIEESSLNSSRRRQRMLNKANRAERSTETPASPLITRLRERLANKSSNSSSNSPTLNITEAGKCIGTSSPMSESASNQLGIFRSSNNTPEVTETESKKAVNFSVERSDVTRYERQPRSNIVCAQSRRYRSASAGANVNRKIKELMVDKQIDPIMSPRTQLKNARQNLKKIPNSGTHSKQYNSAFKPTASNFNKPNVKELTNSFTIVPNNNDRKNKSGNLSSKPPLQRQVSNPSNNHILKESQNFETIHNHSKERSNHKPQYNIRNKEEFSSQTTEVLSKDHSVTTRKNRQDSSSLNHQPVDAVDSHMHVLSSKSSSTEEESLQMQMSLGSNSGVTNSSSPRQRKSWSKTPNTSEIKRNNRMSLPEDKMHPFRSSSSNAPSSNAGTRKSFAEALEDILNPLYESEKGSVTPVVSRNSGASPDANSLTVIGNESVTSSARIRRRNSSVADNINSALGGVIDENWSQKSNWSGVESNDVLRSKTPESFNSKNQSNTSRSNRNSADNLIAEVWVKNYNKEQNKSKPPLPSNRISNETQVNLRQNKNHISKSKKAIKSEHSRQNSAPAVPVQNRREMRRQQGKSWDEAKENLVSHRDSAMLSPKTRHEVVPDYSHRQGSVPAVERLKCTGDLQHTLKSQTTSSSASADPNKPLTALTANDLKPRTSSQNVMPHSVPVKAMFAYPTNPAPHARQNPKRHTGPVSPTLSPQKQIPRMTPPHTPSRSSSSTPYSSLKRTPTSSRSSSLKRNRHRSRSDSSPHQSELDRFFSTMGMEESVLHNESYFSSNHVSSESDFSFAGASAYVRDSPDEMMDIDPVKPLPLGKAPQTVSIIEKNARVMRWLMSCRANKKSISSSGSPLHSSTSMPNGSVKPMMATQPAGIQSSSKHSLGSMKSSSNQSPPVFLPSEDPNVTHPPVIPPRHKRDVNLHYSTNSSKRSSYHQSSSTPPPPIPPRTYLRPGGYQLSPNNELLNCIPKESDV